MRKIFRTLWPKRFPSIPKTNTHNLGEVYFQCHTNSYQLTFHIMFLHSEDRARLDNRPNKHFIMGSLCFSLLVCLITQCARELELRPVLVWAIGAPVKLLVYARELVAGKGNELYNNIIPYTHLILLCV